MFCLCLICTTCTPDTRGDQKGLSEPLEGEFLSFVSHHVALGTEPGSSVRAAGALATDPSLQLRDILSDKQGK